MKTTVFNSIHKSLDAKMVEFAGFEMPIQYPKGIIHEHKVVRNAVGVFDVTHMGEFDVKGKDALNFVQKITVNDASKLTSGKVQYSAMCMENGGIVDDLLVYRFEEDHFMLVVNGACVDKDFAWCLKNTEGFDVKLKNVSDNINLLAIQGPRSLDTLQKLTDVNLSDIVYYTFVPGKLAGVDMLISRTGYTGELGFELYFEANAETAIRVWDEIFKAGEEFGIEPIGLAARDTLRLEKGYMLYGNDIDETTNPLEAGLGWITKLNKGLFNGSDVLNKVKSEGLTRRLVGFEVMTDKFIARHDYNIVADGRIIGKVTSGNMSPILEKAIGMGYVEVAYKELDTPIEIEARGKTFPAKVVKVPFVG